MKPICLIIPPSPFLLDERVFCSLGILKVAAVLEQHGHKVDLLDLSGISNYEEVASDYAERSKAEIYGITATTPQLPASVNIARVIRHCGPAKIILGGPHVTLMNAARKREWKLGISDGRARPAFEKLQSIFEVLVAGDGETTILQAIEPDAPQLIDADDIASNLFLTSAALDKQPLPARHLLDMDSYHYTIEGERATSLIAQLGCLAAGTTISLADGRNVPIEEVQKDDCVICFDETENIFMSAPITQTYNRYAQDLWEITTDANVPLFVTSEHPIWTTEGWMTVEEIKIGSKIATVPKVRSSHLQNSCDLREVSQASSCAKNLPELPEAIRVATDICARKELVFIQMQGRMGEDKSESEVDAIWTSGNAGKVVCDDSRRTCREFKYRTTESGCCNSTLQEDNIRFEEGRPQSYETPRCSTKSIGFNQGQMDTVSVGKAEETVARWQDAGTSGGIQAVTQRSRKYPGDDTCERGTTVSVRGKLGILDRPLSIRKASQPGLHRQDKQEGDPSSRRLLAQPGECGNRCYGLPIEGLVCSDSVVERTGNAEETCAIGTDTTIRYSVITRKRFIGPSKVYNITVCPGHSYIANGILVHNCPYICSFCSGRESATFRRIRTRSTENIIRELKCLYKKYHYKGWMFYDDELNVNKNMVELMEAIAKLQSDLGVEFKLRGFIKSNLFTNAQAEAMYKAGFRWILVGFESGSPIILENINKKATREQNTQCMEIAHNHGLKVKALMSIGHPGESVDTVAATQAWLLKAKPDDFDVTIITTYPGAPYYDHATQQSPGVWTYTCPKSGDRLHQRDVDFTEVSDYYKGKIGDYQSYVFTDYLTAQSLVCLRDKVETTVRSQLGIPFNPSFASMRYEHSMGQGMLPDFILRSSDKEK